ncbi:MAG: efflux RND transporter periplasmic adaptor subunit [Methylotenera sp.]|nr:efflux RND transporter periplasmic adaptor subunit [Methylotenera sp.]MDP3302535.1 efflux RND transporter periplasmic adaptor subunit [Methylotenera sp.]MDP3942921.1 efflux RND transporter periplasmic adaptor subunit [Methylotenera sp.]
MTENNMKKTIIFLSLTLSLAACDKPIEPLQPPRPALVTIVGTSSVHGSMVLVGEVRSRYEVNLGFRINGKIIERKVEVGSLVKKGQVLARLDATDTHLSAAAAVADVRVAEANHALAKAEFARQRILFDKKFISASALDMREAELKTAHARLQQVKARADVSNNQSRYSALVADRDGVVTQIHAEPGQVVEAGEMVAQVVDTQQIEVLVAVPESRMQRLKIGDQATIKLWADRAKTYRGEVREIAPAANAATRTFDVRVTIKNADDAIKLGMTAGVSFGQHHALAEIIIPSTALTQHDGKTSVWVIDERGIATPRQVIAGAYSEAGVVITSGLQAGEMVAIAGVHTLISGQKVKPKIESVL